MVPRPNNIFSLSVQENVEKKITTKTKSDNFNIKSFHIKNLQILKIKIISADLTTVDRKTQSASPPLVMSIHFTWGIVKGRFWLSRSGVEPEILHLQQPSSGCWCCRSSHQTQVESCWRAVAVYTPPQQSLHLYSSTAVVDVWVWLHWRLLTFEYRVCVSEYGLLDK